MRFLIGHKSIKNSTGITVILSEDGAVAGLSVRGSSPATRESDLLRSGNTVDKVNAIVLSGGSAFGLDACSGVMQYCKEKHIGFRTPNKIVPIVVGACLYDLEYNGDIAPSAQDGYDVCASAGEIHLVNGSIGAGTGATVGKIFGASSQVKSGIGMAEINIGNIKMTAVVAVNAFGNVHDYKNGQLIKGATVNGVSIDIVEAMMSHCDKVESAMCNTTIGCIMTNAKLTKTQANKLADIAHDGYAMTIRPVHTLFDGDAIYTIADGSEEVDFTQLTCIAPTLIAQAVNNACR